MAELRQVPGGRETPQGELRPEVVEDEVPRSPVAEEPGGGGSSSSEAKLSPREEEELDPRIQEELEHLNQASEEINQVELQLDVRGQDHLSEDPAGVGEETEYTGFPLGELHRESPALL
ncbi:SH3BP5L isoform 3 [Pongo abelii]|uniref:SH3 domain-binding protein 5 n=1 Tax=Pongo abelii TaxID=9601 RepID=A0A2J8RJP2_PONAB|nr:SH3BP5L isoform 3 [Pongo abelii]